jgi:hypothetical protein
MGIHPYRLHPKHNLLGGGNPYVNEDQKLTPDQSDLEILFSELESQILEYGLPDRVDKDFIERFRRIVGLEYLSRVNKDTHRKIMNHHIISKIISEMSLIRKYPKVQQARFNHFSGLWQNTLNLLVAFNKTSYTCLKQKEASAKKEEKLVHNNDPYCLEVPKSTSELDFELSAIEEDGKNVNQSSYSVRVIYNGESLGLCVDSPEEYRKPI